MKESSFWSQRIRPQIAPYGFCQRIEDGLGAGTPDVIYCLAGVSGFIENKYRALPPKRGSTIVFPPARGLRAEQVAWWRLWLDSGGQGAIIAGVGRETFCLPATIAVVMGFNRLSWDQLHKAAVPGPLHLILGGHNRALGRSARGGRLCAGAWP